VEIYRYYRRLHDRAQYRRICEASIFLHLTSLLIALSTDTHTYAHTHTICRFFFLRQSSWKKHVFSFNMLILCNAYSGWRCTSHLKLQYVQNWWTHPTNHLLARTAVCILKWMMMKWYEHHQCSIFSICIYCIYMFFGVQWYSMSLWGSMMFYDVICIEGCSSKHNILCLYIFVLKMLIMKDSSYNDKVVCPKMNYTPQQEESR